MADIVESIPSIAKDEPDPALKSAIMQAYTAIKGQAGLSQPSQGGHKVIGKSQGQRPHKQLPPGMTIKQVYDDAEKAMRTKNPEAIRAKLAEYGLPSLEHDPRRLIAPPNVQ